MLNKFKTGRQLLHIVVGIAVVLLYYFNLIDSLIVFEIVVLGGFLCFLSKKIDIPIFAWFLRRLEREEQRKIFPGRGMLFFFIGVLLVMKLFDKDIALAAIMILALGDSVSHLVGKYFGKTRNIFNGHSRKLLEGTIAGAVFGFLGALLFVPVPEAFFGSLGAMIVEALEFNMNKRTIDDNLIIPLVAGTVMLLVMRYL